MNSVCNSRPLATEQSAASKLLASQLLGLRVGQIALAAAEKHVARGMFGPAGSVADVPRKIRQRLFQRPDRLINRHARLPANRRTARLD